MKHKVKVIKHGDRKEPQPDRQQRFGPHPKREITTTIKLWVSDFKQRRRSEEQHLRLTSAGVEDRLLKVLPSWRRST